MDDYVRILSLSFAPLCWKKKKKKATLTKLKQDDMCENVYNISDLQNWGIII